MNPYIRAMQPMQDVSGLQPVFQNFGQQQANQQAALAQQNQMMNQLGQTQGGMNPMALAMMLRKKDPTKPAPITDYSEMMPDTVQTNSLDR
jgi:carbamate kinase